MRASPGTTRIASASSECGLAHRGKGQVEEILREPRYPYAIIRPTTVFGESEPLLNNMAWALRGFPVVAESPDY